MTTSQSGTGSATRNKNKTKSLSRRMRCCAGSECVDPNDFMDGDLKCDVCKKAVHAFCVEIDNGMICFNCIINSCDEEDEDDDGVLDSD
mmetsp:Transcript_7884/g.14857  ORF Transcript_7884/g.14857 Transcript_7884/m.14857 type:complete len:89 (-) Transcript_7884:56-322(-)